MCLGIPGRIVEINNADFCIGTVDVAGVRRQVNLACIVTDEHPVESCVGDWVLVHVGFRHEPHQRKRGEADAGSAHATG